MNRKGGFQRSELGKCGIIIKFDILEVEVMKRHAILIGIVLAFLLLGLVAFGQEEEKTQQRSATRQTIQNMTVEQKRLYQSQQRQKRGSSNLRKDQPDQIKAIEAIQEQLVKYKTAVQNVNREALLNYEKLPEEEQTKLILSMTKAAQARQGALTTIEEKLPIIRGRSQSTEPLIPINELKSIHQIAIQEKAARTVLHLERMIKRYGRETRQVPQNQPNTEVPVKP